MRMEKLHLDIAKIRFEKNDIEAAKEAVRYCLRQTKRPGIAMQAAKLLMDHERDLHKHCNPSKQTISHEFPTELRIRGVAPDGK
jgi:hypothetical protein